MSSLVFFSSLLFEATSFQQATETTTVTGYVHTMKAHGGGDGPEAVTAALFEALSLPWRPNATKICSLAG